MSPWQPWVRLKGTMWVRHLDRMPSLGQHPAEHKGLLHRLDVGILKREYHFDDIFVTCSLEVTIVQAPLVMKISSKWQHFVSMYERVCPCHICDTYVFWFRMFTNCLYATGPYKRVQKKNHIDISMEYMQIYMYWDICVLICVSQHTWVCVLYILSIWWGPKLFINPYLWLRRFIDILPYHTNIYIIHIHAYTYINVCSQYNKYVCSSTNQ